MALTLLAFPLAYLIGSIPVGYLVALWRSGIDLRRHGSGNIGMTNVLRTVGKGPAFLTLLADVGKGALAVLISWKLGGVDGAALGALGAVVGNCWSIFLGFGGGKGVATGFGALLVLAPLATVPAALVFTVLVGTWRYVSLGSLMGVLCVPLGVALLGYPASSLLSSLAIAAIVIYRHRENVRQLLAGNERKIGERAT